MRNKIFIKHNISSLLQESSCLIDVGKILSDSYCNNSESFIREAEFDAFCYFRKIIDLIIPVGINSVCFSNIGILLEKCFSLDVSKFFLEYAKHYQVYIAQENLFIENETTLYWNIENPKDKIVFAQGVLEFVGDD